MKKAPIKVYYTSLLNVCRRNQVNLVRTGGGDIPPPPKSSLAGPPFLTRTRLMAEAAANPPVHSSGNPCLDLFFNVRLKDRTANFDTGKLDVRSPPLYSHEYLTQLLPKAWSHNALTTLKLICNLLDNEGFGNKDDQEGFFTAAYWLFQHHPETLAANLAPIASFGSCLGSLGDVVEILYRALHENVRLRKKHDQNSTGYHLFPTYREISKGVGGRISSRKRRDKIIAMAHKAAERYKTDPNYRLLHDGISDLYALCFKHDIQNLSENQCIEMTMALNWCPQIDSYYDRATLLFESIAKKVFPPSEEEAAAEDYGYGARERLRKEVLVPLRRATATHTSKDSNRWGYDPGFKHDPDAVEAYLDEVRAGGESEIKADALLPTEIIHYIVNANYHFEKDVVEGRVTAAELQWKSMVEDYLKQGKFRNCLALCDHYPDVLVSLGLLLSELSEEPWKGKVISSFGNPQLMSIHGRDLKSRYDFVCEMDLGDCYDEVDLHKVFDLILELAVHQKLKPEQMVRRVFVFTYHGDCRWESGDFEAVESKFKDKGYGDVVPHIVHVKLAMPTLEAVAEQCTQPGLTVVHGFNNKNWIRSFLDNDGDAIGLDHVMEAAISSDKYQNLFVVD